MMKSLKREETAKKFNDDEVEKRKRRRSAKLLGQQSATFDGLTHPGPGVNGLNAGKQLVQLNSAVAPTHQRSDGCDELEFWETGEDGDGECEYSCRSAGTGQFVSFSDQHVHV